MLVFVTMLYVFVPDDWFGKILLSAAHRLAWLREVPVKWLHSQSHNVLGILKFSSFKVLQFEFKLMLVWGRIYNNPTLISLKCTNFFSQHFSYYLSITWLLKIIMLWWGNWSIYFKKHLHSCLVLKAERKSRTVRAFLLDHAFSLFMLIINST